jgi:hypothetical protein
LHQRTIKIEIITREIKYSGWYQHKKNTFSNSIYTGRRCSFYFCCDNGSPDGRDVQAGLTDRMVSDRPSIFRSVIKNVNFASYCGVPLKLRDAIRRKYPGQLARGVQLHHDNARTQAAPTTQKRVGTS